MEQIAHDALVIERDIAEFVPQMAIELPSLAKGTWRVNSDGSMDLTWRIPPNIKWHDGAPFTSADLVFSINVYLDPDLPTGGGRTGSLLKAASAPDPLTLVAHWSGTYVNADRAEHGFIMPKHLLDQLHQDDKSLFASSTRFSTDFIGVGPYRLAGWERGVRVQFARFDEYYQGRPRFERVIVETIPDPNTMVANILDGKVDVTLPVSVDLTTALEVARRWEGTGNQVRTDVTGRLIQAEIQYRSDVARPIHGLTERGVRQAFYQAIDRAQLTEVATQGVAPVADSWYFPGSELRAHVESSIPQFPYDPSRAQQLLTQIGWVRRPDGVLTHEQTGDRFEIEMRGLSGQGTALEKQLNVIADYWKVLGAVVTINVVPPQRLADAEYLVLYPGALMTNPSGERFYRDRLLSRGIPTAANRWNGFDRGAYNNPAVDALLDKLNVTIDPAARLPLHRELLAEQMGDIAFMPLYWEVAATLMLRGVSGPKMVRNQATNNIFEWDRS